MTDSTVFKQLIVKHNPSFDGAVPGHVLPPSAARACTLAAYEWYKEQSDPGVELKQAITLAHAAYWELYAERGKRR